MTYEIPPSILNINHLNELTINPAGLVWRNRRLKLPDENSAIRPERLKINHVLDEVPFNNSDIIRNTRTIVQNTLTAIDSCADEAVDDSTKNYPIRNPDVDWACVDIKGIDGGSGHIGIDPVMGDFANGTLYSPGNNHADPFYCACIMANSSCNSYYRVHKFWPGGNDFPFGIFIDNADKNHCADAPWRKGGEILAHNWANRLSAVHLEIYSHDENYGGASVWADDFSRLANGGVYSKDLGIVPLPNGNNLNPDPITGEYAVAKLNGYVFTHGGEIPPPGRMTLHVWGKTKRTTSTGVEIQGYASTSNIDNGYYSTGWLYPGDYYCILIDNATEPKRTKIFGAQLLRPFERLDFTL